MKQITFLSIFVLVMSNLSAPVVYASGGKEELMTRELISLDEIDLSEISDRSNNYLNTLNGYFPSELSVLIELKDTEDNLLHEQKAQVSQDLQNGDIVQDISPVKSQPTQMSEERGGNGGPPSGGGGNSGPPSGGRENGDMGGGSPDSGMPMDSEMTEEQAQYSWPLTQAGLKFWNTTREIVYGIGCGNIKELITEETCYIFDFACAGFDLADSENGIKGRVWVDTKGGKPIKISLHDDLDPSYSLDIYLLPSRELGVRISNLYFSQRIEEENDDRVLILSGNIVPSDWVLKEIEGN